MLVVFPALFLVLVCGVSLARPILIPRITLWMAVPISLAAGYVLVSRLSFGLRMLAILPLLGCIGLGLWDSNAASLNQRKPDWPAMLGEPGLGSQPNEILVAGPHAGPLGVMFYSHGRPPLPLRRWQPKPETVASTAEQLDGEISGATPMSTDALAAFIAAGGHPRLFLDGDDRFLIDPVVSRLPRFAQARRQTYPGLTVFEW
jgi:hypothetical protein